MGDDERNLLRACAADPADDLPRLVYGDWLDEHARPDQAAFVRLQVEAARPDTAPDRRHRLLRAADELLDEHGAEWEVALRALGAGEVGYHRGLPVTAAIGPNAFLTRGHDLPDLAPTVTHLRLTAGDPAVHRAAVASTALVHLSGLTFSSAGLGDAGVTALADNPAAVALRHLAVRWDAVGAEGAAALGGGPRLTGLERLDLFANRLDAHAVRELVHSRWLAGLTGLDLGCNPFGDAGAGVLASAPPRERLTRLGLFNCGLGVAGVRLLLSGSGLPALAELDLGDNPLGDAGAAAIAAAPRACRLTSLNLRGCGVGPAGLRALADSRFLGDDLVLRVDGFAGRFAAFRAWVDDVGGPDAPSRGR